jgi:menaquinone-dependent protoporphyrinogen oxidase
MLTPVLVTYATFFGSTREVAEAIAATLRERGIEVDVRPVQEVGALDGYRAVLVGSAVQHGQWLPEAVEFVKANQQALNRVPVALFTVHITNLGNDESSRKNRLAYLDAVRPLLRPVAEVFFAGRFDRRGAVLLLPGLVARIVPPMDLRNWKKIRAWAQTVFAQVE